LKPSRNLGKKAATDWLAKMAPLEMEYSLILGLTHLALAAAATEAKARLLSQPHTFESTSLWPSIFTGIAVIVNRLTPEHKDSGGMHLWYDLLVSAGDAKGVVLKMPELGAEIRYKPGTIVLLCGKSLIHSVDSWGEGDRICLAHFLKENVFKRLEIEEVGWSMQPAGLRSSKHRRT
jgi:hypothetical protein